MNDKRWIICDIDGTIANMTRRVAKMPDWDAVHEDIENDPAYEHVIELTRCLSVAYHILFITGRPEKFKGGTVNWFTRVDIRFHADLIMRPTNNFERDPELKWNLACQYFKGEEGVKRNVYMVIEDRDVCVEMWRNKGLFCIQPRLGDY